MGDLNYDGDRHDSATYNGVTAFTTRENVVLDNMAGGVWELWPADAVSKEGHFDMVCSNAGLCDEATGTCMCFEGFEGSACQRSTCPGGNDCNGHGTCMTINQHLTATGSSVTYDLWDGDMLRACKCDPGYEGIDCMSRICPSGDDPLTTAHQIDETQVVEIKSTATAVSGNGLFGTFTLTYKNKIGQEFTTSPINAREYDPTDSDVSDLVTATKTALEALPNGVVSGVSVTAGFCEKTIGGAIDVKASGTAPADGTTIVGTAPTSGFFRCPSMSGCGNTVIDATDGTNFDQNGDTCTVTTGETTGCTAIANPHCIRLKIKFTGSENAGDLNSLTVDHSSVTFGANSGAALTNAASNSASAITSSVGDSFVLNSDGNHGFVKGNVAASLVQTVGDGRIAGTTITFGASDTGATGIVIPAGAQVQLYCQTASGGTWYNMGKYEMGTTCTHSGSGTCTLASTFNDPAARCSTSSGSADVAGGIKVQLLTDYIVTNVDYDNVGLATEEVGLEFNSNHYKSTVSSVVAYASGTGYILLTESPAGITAADSSSAYALTAKAAGTKENEVCSGRGKCDSTSGLCQCFKGFSDDSCSTQNALFSGEE
jgi:hypothetical protein